MKLEQIFTGCLAEAAYYIESQGEAAIIDPLREVQPYLDRADRDKAQVKYVFETHFHADFVSGHIDLADKTGAKIVYGPTTMETGFEKVVAFDGQVFKVGGVTIEVLHTPGHTMESSCYLVRDENQNEVGLFTGDTLFIGDVGRPDLAQKVIPDLTQEKLAGHLFDSLRNKIMTLPDDLVIYPAHGKGSACGKMMSDERTDTLGNQKKTNYALNPELTRDQFISEVLTGLTPPPAYFPQNVLLNIKGYEPIENVIDKGTKALNPREFEFLANETDAIIIDTRAKDDFREAFIPNSIYIGLEGDFAPWAGTLLPDVNQKILLVVDESRVEEAVTRLARVGFDHTLGYLKGGLEAWKAEEREIDSIKSITTEKLLTKPYDDHLLDVRRTSEYNSEHVLNSKNLPLDYINTSMSQIAPTHTYYVHCKTGYRSVAFISILQAKGFRNLIDVKQGFEGMKESAAFKMTEYVAPTTLL